MDLPLASPVYPTTEKRALSGYKYNRFCTAPREESSRRVFQCLATVVSQTTQTYNYGLENKKNDLLVAVQETQRGLAASSDQRSVIEEALVNVEAYNMGLPIDLMKLDGTWRLQYTSAPDVLILLEAASRLPFFQVGQIFQKFECRDSLNEGIVRNVVRWSIPSLLEEQEGATLIVSAKFSVVSLRNIYLQFEEISVKNLKISEELQALIAPAILPRSFVSLQILQFLRGFQAGVPVRNLGRYIYVNENPLDSGKSCYMLTAEYGWAWTCRRRGVGGLYYLSYLDGNMLLGRAVGGGGVFVFTRAQPLQC